MNKIRAWHFVADTRKLRDGQKLKVGKTYHHDGPVEMCHSGLHASRRVLDALRYAPGCTLCEVEVWGGVVEHSDKLVGRHRTVLSATDVTNVLHEFACQVAEQLLGAAGVKNVRSWDAIDAKRAWLRGDISDAKLGKVWDAALAVWDEARYAASTDARYAAWYTVWDTGVARHDAWDDLNDLLTDMVK